MAEHFFSVFPNENFLDLRLYQYGWERCAPLHAYGPAVRNHYLFHYILSGSGYLENSSSAGEVVRYELQAGQGFLISPGQVCYYSASQDDPWSYVWLEFDGLRAEEYLYSAGLDAAQPIYRAKTPALSEKLREAAVYIPDHTDASPLHLIGRLCLFLDALIQTSAAQRASKGTQLRDFYIQEAVTYMEQNFHRDLTVEEVADVCKLNRSYFSKLFKENMGCPPQEFLIRLRLSKAAELMRTTLLSIGEISVQCGYPNQLHFSRAFKKRYGIAPREWRGQNKG